DFNRDEGEGAEPCGEVDVVYLQNSPLVSRRVVCAPPSDTESAAPSLASSFSPYRSNNASLSRLADEQL
ncbi:hypothetical protein SK128_027094, partial [Halocaridina rubra]